MTESVMREPGTEWITPQDASRENADKLAISRQQRGDVGGRPKGTQARPITMRAIRAVVQRIIDRFQPDKIILFGSYAYGHPKPESDVDLLVIMETPLRSRQQRLEISRALSPRPFSLDIIVRTPREVADRLAIGDVFLCEITTRGKVLYERK